MTSISINIGTWLKMRFFILSAGVALLRDMQKIQLHFLPLFRSGVLPFGLKSYDDTV